MTLVNNTNGRNATFVRSPFFQGTEKFLSLFHNEIPFGKVIIL